MIKTTWLRCRVKKISSYLYDLKEDPFELKNIFFKNHPAVAPLQASLQKWLKKTNDPLVY